MKTGYFLILTFLFGNIFGCQSVAQNNNQTNKNDVAVKSDPLKLRLNNEEAGTTDNPTVLTKKLEAVFKDREDNAIFREGTNETEKTVHLGADRSVSTTEMAKIFGSLKSAGVSPIRIPVEVKNAVVRPNPLTLFVYAGADKARPFNSGIEIGFIGELSNDFQPDKDMIAIAVDKNGAYSLDGKQVSASNLQIEIQTRLKTKAKDKKSVFVQAENYGNMEDVASIAHSAGAVKAFFVTKNIVYNENGVSFSLSPAFVKDKDAPPISESQSINFIRAASYARFEINLLTELISKEAAETEINFSFENMKEQYENPEVSRTDIDGSPGALALANDEGRYIARWIGSRPKDGKYQLVIINFSSCNENSSNSCGDKANFSRSEFLQIMKSIKFN